MRLFFLFFFFVSFEIVSQVTRAFRTELDRHWTFVFERLPDRPVSTCIIYILPFWSLLDFLSPFSINCEYKASASSGRFL
jgi:hypothetical protein